MKPAASDVTHRRIHKTVSRIPRGRVATYGQIARLAGLRGQARLVGYAMHALPAGTRVPWQRVVNARGEISLPGASALRQRKLLQSEGVRFDARGRIDLDAFLWQAEDAVHRGSALVSREVTGVARATMAHRRSRDKFT